MKKLLLFNFLMLISVFMMAQGTTTSSMNGQVTDSSGETLIGVNVTAVHLPTGSFYGTSTDNDGYYRIDNMKVGGPYKITVSYVGNEDVVIDNVILRLGEPHRHQFVLGEESTMLDEIVLVAAPGSVGKNSGSSTQISSEAIENMPTLNRNINDYVRLTPQASSFGDGTSFAGTNNRFNAIYVDGAINNDVFGLAGSGTNGGQTGISPFSIDIIDQFQVVLSPYDVTLGGFAGGGINAVTKSGTNEMKGTAYAFFQNQDMVGKTNGVLADRIGLTEREKVAEFSQKTYGFSLGGPLAKNKAFFFFNAEVQKDVQPVPFSTEVYTGVADQSSESELNALRDHVISTYDYDPGTFGDTSDDLDGLKLFGKVDVNLNDNHKLTLRHQYTKAEQINRNGGSSSNINFSNNGIFFPSVTNSSALELNSSFGNDKSNSLIIGFTNVNDDRDPIGNPFPYVLIDDGANGTIEFGSEPFSSANVLTQKIITITDNFKIYKGKHTFTIGTHNEFYNIRNVFLPWNYGQYEFNSVEDFMSGAPADAYRRVYSLVDGIAGDDTGAAAEFGAMQLGVYGQDAIQISKKLSITAGLRLDMPILTDDPGNPARFNESVLPTLIAHHTSQGNLDLVEIANNVEAGAAPSGQLMISPRVGFEYELDNKRKSVLRGGVGVFTSRIPFVWPGAMYNNNGLTSTFLGDFAIPGDLNFIPDVQQQYTYENPTIPSGDMNLFTKDFKYPQVFRANLALDKEIGNGWNASIEGIFTKTLNNVAYTNLNTSSEVDFSWTGNGGDNRAIYQNTEIDGDDYGAVYVGSNTSQGYAYNATFSLNKRFSNGLRANLAYTYSEAEALNEGTSSQNSSQWRGQIHISDRNNPTYGRSDYAAGSRIIGGLDYKKNWGSSNNFGTTISIFYNGESGDAMSYVIGNRSAQNIGSQRGSTSRNRSLVYVPVDANDINLIDYDVDGTTVTAAEQWENLNAFIESDSGLSSRRGQYAEKNGSRAPWANVFDLAIRQDLGTNLGGDVHKLQLSVDIFNVANLLNKNWGTNYSIIGDFNNYFLYSFEGYDTDGTTPQFTYRNDNTGKDAFDVADLSSRWRMRLGVRYIFE